jgi:phosphoglycolate phosphatase
LETRIVSEKHQHLPRSESAALLDEAFHQFNMTRHRLLRLYPGVAQTLEEVAERGVAIVGHTEASVINAEFRLRKLGIERFFDRLYAPQLEKNPAPDGPWTVGRGEEGVQVFFLSQEDRKPNPRVLLDICSQMRVPPDRTLYVGDSLINDIAMAKEAGAWSAWAEYGRHYDPSDWARLVRITHWSPIDVARAQEARERYGHIEPDLILFHGFAEILSHFRFEPPRTRVARSVEDG